MEIDGGGHVPAAEAACRLIYAAARADLERPPGPVALAEAVLGHGSVRGVDMLPGDVAIVDDVILVRRRTDPSSCAARISRALARIWMQRMLAHPSEHFCSTLGAFLLLPHHAVVRALEMVGPDAPRLATAFVAPEAAVALRIAEIIGRPTLLVTPACVRVRGLPWPWPETAAGLRAIAAHAGPGLMRTCLRSGDVVVTAA